MEWISIEDRLPETGTYLVFWESIDKEDGGWYGQYVCDFLLTWICPEDVKVTHWMPLPEPPEIK